jgi:hypothetical protein
VLQIHLITIGASPSYTANPKALLPVNCFLTYYKGMSMPLAKRTEIMAERADMSVVILYQALAVMFPCR